MGGSGIWSVGNRSRLSVATDTSAQMSSSDYQACEVSPQNEPRIWWDASNQVVILMMGDLPTSETSISNNSQDKNINVHHELYSPLYSWATPAPSTSN